MHSYQKRRLFLFGATGDLATRKIYPALESIFADGDFSEQSGLYKVTGIGRRDWSDADYQEFTESEHPTKFSFINADFTEPQTLKPLREMLAEKSDEEEWLFYYATAPSLFESLTTALTEIGVLPSTEGIRVVVEKPFGHDLESAEKLSQILSEAYGKGNILRTDHVLNQEGLLDLLDLKQSNPILSDWFSKNKLSQIQITYAETLGIEGREKFYDDNGAIRDMLQSHLLGLLGLALSDENTSRADVIRSLGVRSLVTGQYDGYLQEKDIPENSTTETFLAIHLESKLEKWRGVPILMRTGKKMAGKFIDIHLISHELGFGKRNILTFRLNPNSGVNLRLWTAKDAESIDLSYCYRPGEVPDPYTQVLRQSLIHDNRLFISEAELMASWNIIATVDRIKTAPEIYNTGTMGPEESDTLAQSTGIDWLADEYFNYCKM